MPGVSPCAVSPKISYIIIGSGNAVVSGQQVAPSFVTIGIGIGCDRRAGNRTVAVRMGIFFARKQLREPPIISKIKSKLVAIKDRYYP